MKKNEHILNSVVEECKKHLKRMNSAYNKISPSLPIDSNKVKNLTEDEIEHIDQFIYRFTKLQDAIGNKLFQTLLIALGEEAANKSLIDVFNRLEQLEIIEDYDLWKELRDLRNELAHEYEEEDEKTVEKLNLLLNSKIKLQKYFNDILNYIETKKMLRI